MYECTKAHQTSAMSSLCPPSAPQPHPTRASHLPAPPECTDPLAPPPAAVPNTLPWPVFQAPVPFLLPPSALPGSMDLLVPPSSLDPLAPSRSDNTASMPRTYVSTICYALSLHLYGSIWLHPPTGSASALRVSGTLASPQGIVSAALSRPPKPAISLWTIYSLSVRWASTIGSVVVHHPHAVESTSMAPPSSDSTMGFHPG